MNDQEPYRQLEMVWSRPLFNAPPACPMPAGYSLQTYHPGNEPHFYKRMALANWPSWDDSRPESRTVRIIPDGWFHMIPTADMPERWWVVCEQINWPYSPEQWRQADI